MPHVYTPNPSLPVINPRTKFFTQFVLHILLFMSIVFVINKLDGAFTLPDTDTDTNSDTDTDKNWFNWVQ